MRSGLLVCAFFAAGWASIGMLLSRLTPGLIIFPIAVSLGLLALGWRVSGTVPSRGPHVRKLIWTWSIVEGLAIVASAKALAHAHRNDLAFSSAVIIVGLHFFPLARGIPLRLYYATGAGMVFAGLAGLLLPASERPLVIGMSAAVVLWGTALEAIRRALNTSRALAA